MTSKRFFYFASVSLVAGFLAVGCIRPMSPVNPQNPPSNPTGNTATATFTATSTATSTALAATLTPTASATSTATATPTSTFTSTPTATPTDTSTPVPTQTANNTPLITPTRPPSPPSGIFWSPASMGSGGSLAQGQAGLFMSVNGAAETTAAITLTTPSGDVPLIYYSQYYPGYGYYGSAATFAYVPGGTYTLTTITSIGTATATLVAPGGGVSVSPDGSTASWNVEGNEDYINVWGGGLAGFSYQSGKTTSDVDTPFPIPSSAYPVPGTYRVEVVPQNATYNVTGAAPGSYFYIDDDEVMTVTR